VINWLLSREGGFDGDLKVGFQTLLAYELLQTFWAEREFVFILFDSIRGNGAVIRHACVLKK
jgi:hypothetical protein